MARSPSSEALRRRVSARVAEEGKSLTAVVRMLLEDYARGW